MDPNNKTPLLVLAAVLLVYGVFGWLDIAKQAQGGWATDPNNTVTQVLAGSPTEAAGLQVGDKIISMGGIAMTDAKALSQRARPEVGETWEFIVERDGETVSLDVTFGELVPERKFLAHAGFLVGFCFIGFTMRAYLQKQTASTQALALAGALFSLAFLGGPYFESYMVRSVDNAISIFLGVILIGLIGNALVVMNVNPHLRSVVIGLIIIAAITINEVTGESA